MVPEIISLLTTDNTADSLQLIDDSLLPELIELMAQKISTYLPHTTSDQTTELFVAYQRQLTHHY